MNKPEFIKICGLSVDETLDAAIEGGANYLGFVFFDKSPRHVTLEQARRLSEHVNGRALKVAVTVDADDASLEAIVNALEPDMLQLHGNETPERVNKIKSKFGLPLIKALSVRGIDDLENAKNYIGIADRFLFDAKAPTDSDLPGGNGIAFDWGIMDQWPQDVPYILSGGLSSANIGVALAKVAPWGVDLSSGLEIAPGVKDINLINEFLEYLNEGK